MKMGMVIDSLKRTGADLDEERVAEVLRRPPEPPLAARVVLGFGIWMGAGMVASILKFIDELLRADSARLGLGIVFLAAAAWISRRERWGDVKVHLTILTVVLGEVCITSTFRHQIDEYLLGLFFLQLCIAFVVRIPMARFSSTGLACFWLLVLLLRSHPDHAPYWATDLFLVVLAALFVLIWLHHEALLASFVRTFVKPIGYAMAVSAVGVAVFVIGEQLDRRVVEVAFEYPAAVSFALGGLLVVVNWTLIGRLHRRDRLARPWALRALALVASMTLSGLCLHAPHLMLGPLLLVLGFSCREKALTWLGGTGLIVAIVALYFDVDGSLAWKAAGLAGAGAFLLVLRSVGLRLVGAGQVEEAEAPSSADAQTVEGLSFAGSMAVRAGAFEARARRFRPLHLGVAAAVALSIGTPLALAAEKAEVIREGRRVVLSLAPVDPRSLMQGDYMVLRYGLMQDAVLRSRLMGSGNQEGELVFDLDDSDLATEVLWDQAEALNDRQVKIQYKVRKWRIRLGAESYFFEEGQAARYQSAKFAELRVDDDGELVLVGLLDENRVFIE